MGVTFLEAPNKGAFVSFKQLINYIDMIRGKHHPAGTLF